MTDTAFHAALTDLGVPVFTAPPNGDDYDRPLGWQRFTATGNDVRLPNWKPGHAVMAVCGGALAVVDVDPRNGGKVDHVRAGLIGLGVRIFAEVDTPGGGVHFYVSGRPDIPSAHGSIIGWPGVDVQSYGTNVYVPGTVRAKYGGAGYRVRVNDLAAMVDGGDPDGADAFAGWLAEHRAAKTEPFEPAEPWCGGKPDAREAAYLRSAVAIQAAELAAVSTGGRNDALNVAAVKLGNYIGGAGLDQQTVIEALTGASTSNGLLDEDGAASVAATIRSGLRAGKARPRAVPPALDAREFAPGTTSGAGSTTGSADPGGSSEEFWNARDELKLVRDFARSRLVAPWAVFGCVLARVITTVPPNVVLPPTVGTAASLNTFVGLVGPSGVGKDVAGAVAAEAVIFHGEDEIYVASPGSGEGLVHQYVERVQVGDGKQRHWEIRSLRTRVLFEVSEVDSLVALAGRSGSTLTAELRKAWSGWRLGGAYVDKDKALALPPRSYRMCMVINIQPGRAGPLLDGADGGTPQRILWLPALDPGAPDDEPDEPDPLVLKLGSFAKVREPLPIPDRVAQEIRRAQKAVVRGHLTSADDKMGGHLRLTRLKVAQGLAFLNDRRILVVDDWELAGMVIAASEATRRSVMRDLATTAEATAHRRGELLAVEAEATEDRRAGSQEQREQRVNRWVMRWLTDHGSATAGAIRKAAAGRDRDVVPEVLDGLVEQGLLGLVGHHYKII